MKVYGIVYTGSMSVSCTIAEENLHRLRSLIAFIFANFNSMVEENKVKCANQFQMVLGDTKLLKTLLPVFSLKLRPINKVREGWLSCLVSLTFNNIRAKYSITNN